MTKLAIEFILSWKGDQRQGIVVGWLKTSFYEFMTHRWPAVFFRYAISSGQRMVGQQMVGQRKRR